MMSDRQTEDWQCIDASNDRLPSELNGDLTTGVYDIYVGDCDPSDGRSHNIHPSGNLVSGQEKPTEKHDLPFGRFFRRKTTQTQA